MKWFRWAALAALLWFGTAASPAFASACPSYPYALVNGQTADASQVMANFNSILACANSSLATAGANANITSLNAMTTPLSVSQGGTGASTLTSFASTLGPYLQLYLPFDFYVFQGGQTGASWTLASYQPSTNVVLSQSLSHCSYGTAATGSAIYTLTDNGTTVATVTFTSGACSFSYTTTPYTVVLGHTLKLVGPASPDATLADIGLTLGGTRD